MNFRGCATALITPFKNGQVDYDSLGNLIEMQLAGGVKGFLAGGTTGEPPTLTDEECASVVQFVIKKVNGRAYTVAGAGSNSTAHAVELAKRYESMGVNALLVVTPYYNKCTQSGLVAHYRTICEAVNIPIIAYNVPGRTGVNIKPETYEEFKQIKNLEAVKEAGSNYLQIGEIAERMLGTDFSLYSGDDEMIVPFYPLGGKGVFSVASNVIPAVIAKICDLCEESKLLEAQTLAFKYAKFIRMLFCEVNPIPVKAAAHLMGLCTDEIRLPLTKLEDTHLAELKEEMIKLGLINTEEK